MDKVKTAFKHPNCGGIIQQFNQDGTLIFECDLCGMLADDIDQLILRGLVIIRRGSPSAANVRDTPADTGPGADEEI